jgi:cell division protein FtsW
VGFFPHVLGAVLLAGLCYAQPDFGSTAMIILLLFAMLFTAGARLGFIVASAFVGVVTLAIAAASSPYRLRRIAAFWPQAYKWLIENVDWLAKKAVDMKAPDNYQVWESQLSFGAGGIWGVGLGNSHQKLLFLPEAHTDFISSIVAEELGLVGVAAMLLAFGVLVYRGIRTGLNSPDIYGTYLCVGISVFIGMQAFTNLAVAVGVVPTKGLVLPFISFGGTSLVVNCVAVGLMSNASRLQRADAVAAAPPAPSETAARAVGGVS